MPSFSHGRRHCAILLLASVAVLSGAGTDAAARSRAKVHRVTIDAAQFAPQTIEVATGDTVVWTNKDPFPHTVTAENHSFNSGEIASDHSWKFKARKKGSFSYICTLHPTMKGTLVVK